jgi:ubiquinone/menaquinone biosynthesis C-methylase UbiE
MDYYDRIEPHVFQRVVEIIGRPERVIEIGCGDCRLANFIARAIGCTVLGIDTDTQGFAAARRQSKKLKVSHLVNTMKHDAENLTSLCPPKFDCCVSIYVLHELAHPLKVLSQVRKVLRRNGKMLLIDFPTGTVAEQLYDEKYYSARMMQSFLKRAGFRKISLEYFNVNQLALFTAIA